MLLLSAESQANLDLERRQTTTDDGRSARSCLPEWAVAAREGGGKRGKEVKAAGENKEEGNYVSCVETAAEEECAFGLHTVPELWIGWP